MGYGSNWKIWVSPESPFWGDSESSVPKLVTFLIRQGNDKTLAVSKFDLLQIGRFNMFLDLFFERVMNLATKMLDCACGMCYTQNSDWDRRSRLGDLLWLISFKVVLDPNLEGILNLKREILNSHCVSQYGKISDSGRRSRLGDLHQFISLKVVPDPNFKGILNLKREIWNSNCVSPYEKIDDGC
jgi:hypothetical protein